MEKAITVNNIRPIFFEKKNGMPKKESLHSVINIANYLKINIDKNKAERAYKLNLINACLRSLRVQCRERNTLWLDIKLPDRKYVLHGFTQNKEYFEYNLLRCIERENQYKKISKKVKELTNNQLLLFNDNDKELKYE